MSSFYADINKRLVDLNVDRLRQNHANLVLLGDSNAHSTLWGSPTNNMRGDMWEQYLIRKGLFLVNNSDDPTFVNHLGRTHIDLSLSSSSEFLKEWTNTSILNGSDHTLLMMTSGSKNTLVDKFVQNVSKTDWGSSHRNYRNFLTM